MEFENFDIEKCSRQGFAGCYYARYGYFKGKVIKVKKDRFLFKRIYVSYDSGLDVLEDKEDHVWVDGKPFKNEGIKKGDCVSFTGQISPYKRRNGTYDLGIVEIDLIEKIDEYELPTNETMHKQFAQQLICETCLFADQCNGNCIRM